MTSNISSHLEKFSLQQMTDTRESFLELRVLCFSRKCSRLNSYISLISVRMNFSCFWKNERQQKIWICEMKTSQIKKTPSEGFNQISSGFMVKLVEPVIFGSRKIVGQKNGWAEKIFLNLIDWWLNQEKQILQWLKYWYKQCNQLLFCYEINKQFFSNWNHGNPNFRFANVSDGSLLQFPF